MKRFTLKRITALALALIMVLSLCPVTALAELVPEYYEMTTYYVAEDDGISNDELFAAYVQREVDESLGIEPPGFYRTSALKDGTLEKTLYEQLKVRLAAVASGEASSTLFNLPLESPVTLTAEELGVDAIFTTTNGTTLVDGVINAICEKLNLSLIYNCLLADCPLELYWHDKTSLPMGVGYQNDGGDCVVNSVSCHFYVAAEYSSTGATKTFVTDTTKTAAVKTALDNAKSIVDAYANKSDMEKLQGYKDTICSLVSYNTYAADPDNNVNYGNPWQMIWVFDMKSDTNVVCEGYAKAFQYLCDLTDFDGDIQCHTVTGTMSGGTGAGRHMWNVVTMDDGKNYLVDVTNCDSGPIGADNKLFMAYTADSADNNQTHTFTIGTQSVVFIYDTSMAGMFCDGYLALSETVYRYLSATATLTGSTEPLSPGDKITLTLRFDGTNIAGIDAALGFDSDVLQLVSAEELVTGGELYADTLKFLLLNENAPINTATDVLKVTLKVKENVSAGAELSVSFKNIMVSNGNRDLDVGTATWKGSVTAPSDIAISEENFPDANFRSYVADNFDANGDGVLSTEEREAVSTIYCTMRNIGSLTGIEYFPELKALTCYANQLGELDVSKNPALESLDFSGNQLSSIDVSKNSELKTLHCAGNLLTTIDVSKNPQLISLYCFGNCLSNLDVSNNPMLERLECGDNRLTALDVSNNPKLKSLHCSLNQLATIDVSKNPAIEQLSCFDNQLTSLDLSKNTALTSLWCNNNQFEMLDVSKNSQLTSLNCYGNCLSNLDVSKNTALTSLFCDNNQLEMLDVSKNSQLTSLNCSGNRLSNLDVSNNPMLTYLYCSSNQITELNVSNNLHLKEFDCAGNQVDSLDVSKNPLLEFLNCERNQLTALDIKNNPAISYLRCASNQLTSLDLSANTALSYLSCESNQLTALDISGNTNLETLHCNINQLTTIITCNNVALKTLSCYGNRLTNIDVSNSPELERLDCSINKLKSLDVSNNSMLELLNCSSNQLTSIDVSNNSALETFDCQYNQLTSLDVSANTALFFFEGDYNRFSVVLDENKRFDLSTLPGSFDVSKASNWTNGMVSGTILTVTDTNSPVTYDYDCGNDHAVRFTLYLEEREVQYGLAGANGVMPDSWTRGTLTEAMNYSNGLISGTAYIQLCSDVDTFAPLEFASEKNTILDLNGYDIDRGLTQAVDDGNVITVNGTLTLCDTSENAATAPGKITGGYGYHDVGGVWVKDGGTLNITSGAIADNRSEKGTGGMMVDGRGTVNMSGGVICGNKGWQTGGVFLSGGGITTDNGFEKTCGVLNMSGGSITENERTTDNEYGAGGISVIGENSLFLSGSASITGNVKHCGYPSNIWLKGDSVIITGELSGSFGIGREYEEFDHPSSYLVAEGTDDYAITAEDRAKFTSDNGHDILLNNRENHLMLAPGAYAVSFDLQGIEGSVDSQTILYGELVMQPDSPTTEDYAFLGWYKEPACENIWNFDTDIVTKTTVLYAKWGEKTDKDGLWCEDIAPQTYTGSDIKPMVRVYFRDKLLTEKVDYTLSYKNNTNAADCDSTKAPTITIKGKGNFSGTLTKTFTILPADIGSNLPIEEIYAAANDRGQKPKITVTVGNRKLSTKDMTVEYFDIENGGFSDADKVESCVGVGDWAIVVSGQGNYTGDRIYLFTAVGADKLISKAKLSLSAKSITYDGNWHTPEVKVMIGKTELTEGEHYSVSYRDNHGVGTATVTVTGINGYVGTATTTFKITGIPMSKMKVEFLNKATGEYSTKAPSYTYTGAPIKMYEDMGDFRVYYDAKVDGETMRVELSPLEYSVSYQNNDRKGTATMLLTGKEAWGFTGSKKISFKINAYNILSGTEEFHVEMAESVPYMKGGAKPEPMITFNGEPLEAGVDYTISYKNNMAIADENSAKVPMITITGKGDFTGKMTVNFTVEGKKLSKTDLSVDDVVFSEKGLKAPKLTITDKDGKKLVAGKDYEKALSYRCNGKEYANIGDIGVVDAGTEITVIATGNGTTYTGMAEKTFRVVKASLAKATVKVANQQYTGKPIIPDKSDITVTVNKDKVDPENFEIVSCTNNVNKGSATLTIRGVGENYGGFKTVKFKIDAKAMAWSNLQSTLFDLFT